MFVGRAIGFPSSRDGCAMTNQVQSQARRKTVAQVFPDGIPWLWCPPLTHFRAARGFDEQRIRRHLEVLSPFVKGILVPGSTGGGWEMNDEEIQPDRGYLE